MASAGEYPYCSSAAVTEDYLVIGGRDQHLHCLDRRTGERRWQIATRGRIDGSPVVAGNRVVVGSHDGRLYAVDLTDGTEVWTYEIGAPLSVSPAIAEGRMVIAAEDGTLQAFATRPLVGGAAR